MADLGLSRRLGVSADVESDGYGPFPWMAPEAIKVLAHASRVSSVNISLVHEHPLLFPSFDRNSLPTS